MNTKKIKIDWKLKIRNSKLKAKLLLHTCCGPCFLGVWQDLKNSDLEVTNFFYNPNIWPEEEYQKRKRSLEAVIKKIRGKLFVGDYFPKVHADAVRGEETNFPTRCISCYRIRLEETAKKAKFWGYEMFSTTLLVSPYQDHDAIISIGNELAQKYKIKFLDKDWRPFFREGQNQAKISNIYRQKYCGCKYSLKETRKSNDGEL